MDEYVTINSENGLWYIYHMKASETLTGGIYAVYPYTFSIKAYARHDAIAWARELNLSFKET
jgi:hypothetical protein